MTTDFTVIIPARFASTRLPGKMLADINGKPMLAHVYQRAQESNASDIIIATDHPDIAKAAKQFGAKVVMTSESHPSGTDRLQEVCDLSAIPGDNIVVNIQGDEPLIPAAVINQVAALLAANQQASVATLCEAITDVSIFTDPNVVKVVLNYKKHALYFSRAPIPWPRDAFSKSVDKSFNLAPTPWRHLGIYAYRVALLNRFVQWPVASLEAVEKLEQLRVLANGEIIVVDQACEFVPAGVDTLEDLERIRDQFS